MNGYMEQKLISQNGVTGEEVDQSQKGVGYSKSKFNRFIQVNNSRVNVVSVHTMIYLTV